uniref:Tetraspanin n=1 Tax=Callorhinus ursinus TaxID=34884 RepID=A0A3Q7MH00_CALUR|nr:tetraspanin-14 isoform X1 [Callorhinus ursinus]
MLSQIWVLVSTDPASQKMHYYRYSNAEVSCWYKYLLFSYNIVFWLAGVVFLGVGLWAWSEKGVLSDLTKVTRLHGIDPVVLVLMVGVVMFTLGFAGCVGALRENICLLKFFCGTIVLIFFLELAVAVLAFLFQDWVRDRFREFFESNIRSYRDDIDLQNLIDSLQKANQCCGAYGPEDWDLNVYFNCSGASYSREKCGVPFSCCVPDPAQKVVNTQCGYDVRTQLKSKWDESIFTKGCIQALEGWLPRNIYIVAGVFIAISLLQIFGIFLAKTLISDIEAVKAGHHF